MRVAMQRSARRSSVRRAEIGGMRGIFACIAQDVRHVGAVVPQDAGSQRKNAIILA
jgi:hypothetical protein